MPWQILKEETFNPLVAVETLFHANEAHQLAQQECAPVARGELDQADLQHVAKPLVAPGRGPSVRRRTESDRLAR
jgi:hypothetical protein